MLTEWLILALLAGFYLAGILSAISAVMNSRTSQGAIAWSLSMLTFPFLAVPAYWVFGRSKFKGVIEAYNEQSEEIDALVVRAREQLDDRVSCQDMEDPYYATLARLCGSRPTTGNQLELLINGEATFASLLAGIEAASTYVLVQFYTIRDDELGRQLRDLLVQKAQQGLTVCLLYDEIGSLPLPGAYLKPLKKAGAQVSGFRATRGWLNRFQLNFRNHRKIVVTDGRAGWVGGHNVGDAYLGKNERLSPWRDTHVRIQGPMVQQLQAVFVADWYWAKRDLPELEWQPEISGQPGVTGMIVATAPTQSLETASLMFVHLLDHARHRVWISAPYFVPDGAVMAALQLAALRGVDVRIVVPGTTDNRTVRLAGFHFMMKLAGLGIRFYEYQNGMLHSKTLLVDDKVCGVGTANFDNRSFRLNFEVTSLFKDDQLADEMEKMFEQDFAHSTELDEDSLKNRPFLWRLVVSVTRLAAPLL